MLAPQAVGRRQIVYAGEKRKVVQLHRLDAHFVFEFAFGGSLDAQLVFLFRLAGMTHIVRGLVVDDVERM